MNKKEVKDLIDQGIVRFRSIEHYDKLIDELHKRIRSLYIHLERAQEEAGANYYRCIQFLMSKAEEDPAFARELMERKRMFFDD